ncbi:MAG: HEAT repeat domain-containing protein [Planctomycetota bacterium]|jgi:HEAT repeat protein
MRKSTFLLMFVVTLFALTADQLWASEAEKIIKRYLKMPNPKDASFNEARVARLNVLAELKSIPEQAIDAIGRSLLEVENPRQRYELASMLGDHFHIEESAALLCKLLQDPDEKVRWQAIHGLRMMARRTDRTGGKRLKRGQDFEPKVQGLVPYLISAASDKAERNRVSALYALADSRDPSAVSEMRNRLKDPGEKVRLYAACFLTEYQDAAGLPEMRKALSRCRRIDVKRLAVELDYSYYHETELLLASLERITGKSFGPIPLNPTLCSDLRRMQDIKKRYKALLDTWAEWWAWEPKAEER